MKKLRIAGELRPQAISMLYDIIYDYVYILKDNEKKRGLEKIFQVPIKKIVDVWVPIEKEYGRVNEKTKMEAFKSKFEKEGVTFNSKYNDLVDQLYYGD